MHNVYSGGNVMPETSKDSVSNRQANFAKQEGSDIDSSWSDWPVMAGANAIQSTVMHGQVPQPKLPTECWYICWYNAMQGALLCKQHQCEHSNVKLGTTTYALQYCRPLPCLATTMQTTVAGQLGCTAPPWARHSHVKLRWCQVPQFTFGYHYHYPD